MSGCISQVCSVHDKPVPCPDCIIRNAHPFYRNEEGRTCCSIHRTPLEGRMGTRAGGGGFCVECYNGAPPRLGILTPTERVQTTRDPMMDAIGKTIGECDWRAEEGLITKMTRTQLFAFFPQWCEEATDISRQRNRSYATEQNPFANLNRDDTLTGVIQEIANCFKRLQNYANYWAERAIFDKYGLKHPEQPPMTEEQVRDAETDLHNFSHLFRGLRLELSNKRGK